MSVNGTEQISEELFHMIAGLTNWLLGNLWNCYQNTL